MRQEGNNGSRYWIWGAAGLIISGALQAATPLWTYSAPSPAQVAISDGTTATVSYTVTNQSKKTKNLVLKATQGLSASDCQLAQKGSTCHLTLTINGSQIPKQGLHAGPILCEQGNPNQCYQPEAANQLNISRSSSTLPGHLLLRQYGMPLTTLSLSPGDSGTLLLTNTGESPVSSLVIQLPFGWQSYFNNTCPSVLDPQQTCSITYTIPTPSATGILNPLTVHASDADNSLKVSVSIQSIGAVNCWGDNLYGQLGNGSNIDASIPAPVSNLHNAIAITGGGDYSCALLANGEVNCWGANNAGQLGNGNTNNASTPVPVNNLSNAIAITGGAAHTCALLASGEVNCWGNNNQGQLGNGSNIEALTPVPVSNLSNAVAITAGGHHTCALLATGEINCWGLNDSGQLGNGSNNNASTPMPVNTLSNAIAITGGCALLNTGEVNCWGLNNHGQLGNSSNSNTNTPVSTCSVSGCSDSLSALEIFNHNLGYHSCAIVP